MITSRIPLPPKGIWHGRKHHKLKTLTNFYQDVERGKKKFEVRFNDRDFKVGDIVCLQEFIPPSTYTGREIRKEVGYILDDLDYCKEGFVVLGLKD
jgi:hypothetical protein